jgi:hypothetical protein
MATQLDRSWCVLQLRKKESETIVQRAFRTQLQMEPTSRVSTYAWYKKSSRRSAFAKTRVVVSLLCHIQPRSDLLRGQPKKIEAPIESLVVTTTNTRHHNSS